MKARQWMEIAALASTIGLTGTAVANDLDRTPAGTDASVASAVNDALAERHDTGGSAALPRDAPANAAMNRAAELGTRAPGAPLASDDEGVNAGAPMNGRETSSGMTNEGTPARANAAGERSNDAAATSGGATLNDEGATSAGATLNDESATSTGPTTSDEQATPGSTMNDGSTASGTASGSGTFDAWANDYAAQHNGRITRQEFLGEMGNRFDRLDTQHQGYLTPDEVGEIFIFTPADTADGASMSSDETGSANAQ